MTFTPVGNFGVAAIAAAQSDSFDLETALMAVQQGRIRNLDEQLQAQIEGIQASNARATRLNEAYKDINAIIDKFGSETNPDKKRSISAEETQALEAALKDLGIDPSALFGPGFSENDRYNADATAWNQKDYQTRLRERGLFKTSDMKLKATGYSNVSLSNFKSAAATIKGQIDTNSNTQQMDMLRLQSLTNKRNEAFETMSSVMKKIQDANSSILNKV